MLLVAEKILRGRICSPPQYFSLMTAAGDEKKSNDDEPDPVVIEDRAETVVIHIISSLGDM